MEPRDGTKAILQIVPKDLTSGSYYSNDSNKSIFTNHSKLLFLGILLLGYCR